MDSGSPVNGIECACHGSCQNRRPGSSRAPMMNENIIRHWTTHPLFTQVMRALVEATKVTVPLLAVLFVTAVQGQTVYRKPQPISLKLTPSADGELTGTIAFSLSSGISEREFAINPDAGVLHILCTWESATPLTVAITRAAGHGLPGKIAVASQTAQSPITLDAHIEPEQLNRGPIYIEISFGLFQRGHRETVHGTL